MCDVHLIYLRNNKYSEIKCKPEVLSPLPRPIPFKRESPPVQHQLEIPIGSSTQEVVVGILDANQSSCTLLSLPSSPQTNQIEAAKKEVAMKDSGETVKETSDTQLVETPTNNSVDKPSNIPETILSPVTNTSAQTIKGDQCKVDQLGTTENNIADDPSGTVDQAEPMCVETAPKSVETVLVETGEDVNKNNKTKSTIVTSNSETNKFEIKGEIKDTCSPITDNTTSKTHDTISSVTTKQTADGTT